jgi:hypothetical protein
MGLLNLRSQFESEQVGHISTATLSIIQEKLLLVKYGRPYIQRNYNNEQNIVTAGT